MAGSQQNMCADFLPFHIAQNIKIYGTNPGGFILGIALGPTHTIHT